MHSIEWKIFSWTFLLFFFLQHLPLTKSTKQKFNLNWIACMTLFTSLHKTLSIINWMERQEEQKNLELDINICNNEIPIPASIKMMFCSQFLLLNWASLCCFQFKEEFPIDLSFTKNFLETFYEYASIIN